MLSETGTVAVHWVHGPSPRQHQRISPPFARAISFLSHAVHVHLSKHHTRTLAQDQAPVRELEGSRSTPRPSGMGNCFCFSDAAAKSPSPSKDTAPERTCKPLLQFNHLVPIAIFFLSRTFDLIVLMCSCAAGQATWPHKPSGGDVGRQENGRPWPASAPGPGRVLEAPRLRQFTLAELRAVTRGFKPEMVLGEGGFGRVYKGWVDERTLNPAKSTAGIVVAVKKLNPESVQGLQEWQVNRSGLYLVSLVPELIQS